MAGGIALIAVVSFLSASAWGKTVILSWNPSTNADVVGYNLYYGGASQTYTNMASVGDLTNATVTGLIAGDEYFFAATSVDSTGLESVFSNEISYQVPGGQPGPATPPITWTNPAAIVYGTALGAGQLNATSSVPGIFTYNPPAGTVLGAGNQVLSVTFNPTDTNSYAPVTDNVAVVVMPAVLTITANNASKLYGAALPALAAGYSGFVNGDTASSLTTRPALGTTATAASPVGGYPITASGAAGSNYTISYVSGTLSVNPAALKITAVNTNKLYGAALPALAASYSGFVNGNTANSLTTRPALSTTATAASPVGSYPITASGAAGSNYTISYVSGTLSINPAALKITAVNTNKLYGAALPALTASYTGFVNGNTASNLTTRPVLSTTATAASPVGSYPITASGAACPNYTISYVSGTLTVNKAALKITANNASKAYGAPLPALTASYSGFVNGDTAGRLTTPPTLTTTATAASPVGKYPITASGAASPNYAISYVSGTLTVTKNGQKLIIETNLSRILAITDLGDGSVAIGGEGIPGFTYLIQSAASPWSASDWSTLGTVTADSSGAFSLIDRGGSAQRFYRAIYP